MDSLCIPVALAELLNTWRRSELECLRRPYLVFNRVRNLLFALQLDGPLTCWRDITPARLRCYLENRRAETPRGKPLAAATIKRELQDVTNFLRFCESQELTGPIRSNHIMGLAPSINWINPRALDDMDEAWLIARAREIHRGGAPLLYFRNNCRRRAVMRDWAMCAFHACIIMSLDLGARPGEALFAHRDEFSFGARTLWRPQNLPARPLKNELAGTPMVIPERAEQALREFVRATDPRGYLWALPDIRKPGGFRAPYYDQIWRSLAQEGGLEGLNMHWLRHTYCTRTANRPDLSMQQVLELTRHQNPLTLQRYYKRRDPVCPTTGRRIALDSCVPETIAHGFAWT